MVNIFVRSFDYTLFLYILSLFVLSGLCFIRPFPKRSDSISFYPLGIFALLQGLGEWMNIFAHAVGDSALFLTIRALIFIISYFFLLKLASKGTRILFLRPVKKLVYLLLIVFSLFSFVYLGPKGALSAVHFFFALFVGGYCCLIIYLYSYKEKTGGSLRVFSLFLALYFVLRGLVVPKSSFFISSWINYGLFSNLFGFPVQLALFVIILAAVSAFAVNVYSTVSEARARYKTKISIAWPLWIFTILLILVSVGSVFTFYWSLYTKREKDKIVISRIKILSTHLCNILDSAGQIVRSLSGSYKVKDALQYRNSLAIEQLNSQLDNYVESFGIDICYIMDNKGFVIATSNRNSPASFLGKNYAFRPYFKDALESKQGSYFALGVTSKKRGFYTSYPVKDKWGNVSGVSVVKMNIRSAEDIFKSFSHALLVSPAGIIFMSSDKQYLLRSFYPVDNIYKQKIIYSRQFGNVNFNPLLKKECFEGDEVLLGDGLYYVFRTFIGYGGWSIVVLWHNKPILITRFFCISTTLFILILFLLFVAVLIKREEIFDKISQLFSEYKAILNATSGVIIISVDMDGNILSSNSGTERILGYKKYELKGKNIVDCLFIKDDVDNYAGAITKETGIILEGFYALTEEAKSIIIQKQWSITKKDKTTILVDLSITSKRSSMGEVTGFIFTAFDITAFKHIQEQLRSEKSRIEMSLNTASVIMLMLNRKGKVVFINKTGSEALGYDPDEIIGKDWFSNFLTDEGRDDVRNIFNKLIQGKEYGVKTYTNHVLTKRGKRMVSWNNVVICDDSGKVTGILGSGNDISRIIEKETELKAKVDELEKFQKFVVGRELKMKELKKRIKELEENLS